MTKQQIQPAEMRLYTNDNRRLYLNETERDAFIATAANGPPVVRLFCLTLAYTGCRLSEARYLKLDDIQTNERLVSIKTLKRRRPGHIREVPIPERFIQELKMIQTHQAYSLDGWLFSESDKPPSRTACYRWVKNVMENAGVSGPQACPKGLRHAYGVHVTQCGIQLHMLQKWMGHASMETTAIYATALGPEEQEMAKRIW